jgi:hypothetical protein
MFSFPFFLCLPKDRNKERGRAARSKFTTGAVLRFAFPIVDGDVKLERNKAPVGLLRLEDLPYWANVRFGLSSG